MNNALLSKFNQRKTRSQDGPLWSGLPYEGRELDAVRRAREDFNRRVGLLMKDTLANFESNLLEIEAEFLKRVDTSTTDSLPTIIDSEVFDNGSNSLVEEDDCINEVVNQLIDDTARLSISTTVQEPGATL
jgi:hypothetical protein